MRTYEQTHTWISFRWEPRRLTYPVWLLLGEATALVRMLGEASLPAGPAIELERTARIRGIDAMAAMEGNTLTEEQVARCLAGELKLPTSHAYLGQEVQNLAKALVWTEDRLRAGDRQFSPWSIQLLNAQVLKGLPWDEETSPGEYRSSKRITAVQDGVPAEDIAYLIERLCEWLTAERFTPEHEEEAHAFALVRAMLAQLYLLWIRPFADGNVRTAWLVTGQLLMEAGVPPFAVHRFFGHVGRVRRVWEREMASAGQGHGDPVPFIAFLSRLLRECLLSAAEEVEMEQRDALLSEHLHRLFGAGRSANGTRRKKLLVSLNEQTGAVPHGRIPQLNPDLAAIYARLDRKTLLRDIHHLQQQGLVGRVADGVVPTLTPLRAFKPLLKG
ncbi:MAG: Fic family protein [Flavobacteriales bacterium]|nr:Fic family protein [Flavobacteriales bacterium]